MKSEGQRVKILKNNECWQTVYHPVIEIPNIREDLEQKKLLVRNSQNFSKSEGK